MRHRNGHPGIVENSVGALFTALLLTGTTLAHGQALSTAEPEPAVGPDAAIAPATAAAAPPPTSGTVSDPWEHYNRRVFHFNQRLDARVAKPLAVAYEHSVPRPIRSGVTHFFSNLHQPINAANLLLQGHPARSGESVGRFLVNATIGIAGVFDPATPMHIPQFNEDFGQTLGRWGWKRSRYLLIPFLGPGTLRDRIGRVGDGQIGWYHAAPSGSGRLGLLGLSLVDKRAQMLALDQLDPGVGDEYTLVRDAWAARRAHQIADQSATAANAASDEQELRDYDLPTD